MRGFQFETRESFSLTPMLALLQSGLAVDEKTETMTVRDGSCEVRCRLRKTTVGNHEKLVALLFNLAIHRLLCWSVARYATSVKQELSAAEQRALTDRSARRAWHTM